MNVRIDKERNIVRIIMREAPIVDSEEDDNGLILDYDAAGHLVGLEFLDAMRVFGDLDELEQPLVYVSTLKSKESESAPTFARIA